MDKEQAEQIKKDLEDEGYAAYWGGAGVASAQVTADLFDRYAGVLKQHPTLAYTFKPTYETGWKILPMTQVAFKKGDEEYPWDPEQVPPIRSKKDLERASERGHFGGKEGSSDTVGLEIIMQVRCDICGVLDPDEEMDPYFSSLPLNITVKHEDGSETPAPKGTHILLKDDAKRYLRYHFWKEHGFLLLLQDDHPMISADARKEAAR